MWNTFVGLVDGIKLKVILILIALDFILGIVVAVKDGTFKLSYFSNYLKSSVFYYVGGYYALGLAATVEPSIPSGAVTAAWIGLDLMLLGMVLDKISKLGVPVPVPLH